MVRLVVFGANAAGGEDARDSAASREEPVLNRYRCPVPVPVPVSGREQKEKGGKPPTVLLELLLNRWDLAKSKWFSARALMRRLH